MYCPHCGHTNNDYASFCGKCGQSLPKQHTFGSTSRSPSPPQPAHSDQYTDKDYYKAFIGPQNQDYYLDKFARFDQAGSASVSWHWPAFFISFFWFSYRKLWGHAILYLLIGVLAFPVIAILSALAGKAAGLVASISLIIFSLGMWLIPPLYANAFYYRACHKRMRALQAVPSRDERRKLERLYNHAGCSMAGPLIGTAALLFCSIPLIGILAAIALPAYQDYTRRAQISAALSTGTLAKDAIGTYYAQNGQLPAHLTQTSFRLPVKRTASDPVTRIDFDNQTGFIYVRLSPSVFSDSKNTETASIVFIPALNGNALSWQCHHENVNRKYLPVNCRKELPETGSAGQSATG